MSLFKQKTPNGEFLFPVFKFLSRRHADALLSNGSGRIPLLAGFRDSDKYGGKVFDSDEGIVQIRNHYTHYRGLAKDANGLLCLQGEPYSQIEVFQKTLTQRISLQQAFAYCVTQHLFSDSVLEWANERSKDACVLIKDFDLFLSIVNQLVAEQLRFVDVRECVYSGREISEVNPSQDSLTNFILSRPHLSSFIKPKDYEQQREIRAVWLPAQERYPRHVEFASAELAALCLEVDYSAIRNAIANGKTVAELEFGGTVYNRASATPSTFTLTNPPEICSPVLSRSDTRPWYLGFR
jgi:hypothetical protein